MFFLFEKRKVSSEMWYNILRGNLIPLTIRQFSLSLKIAVYLSIFLFLWYKSVYVKQEFSLRTMRTVLIGRIEEYSYRGDRCPCSFSNFRSVRTCIEYERETLEERMLESCSVIIESAVFRISMLARPVYPRFLTFKCESISDHLFIIIRIVLSELDEYSNFDHNHRYGIRRIVVLNYN